MLVELLHTFQVKLVVRTQFMKHCSDSVAVLMPCREGREREGEDKPVKSITWVSSAGMVMC